MPIYIAAGTDAMVAAPGAGTGAVDADAVARTWSPVVTVVSVAVGTDIVGSFGFGVANAAS